MGINVWAWVFGDEDKNAQRRDKVSENLLIGNAVTKVRSSSDDQKHGENIVAGNHNLTCELVAKVLLSIRTQEAEKGKEEHCGKTNNWDHDVSQVNVTAKHPVQRNNLINEGIS